MQQRPLKIVFALNFMT